MMGSMIVSYRDKRTADFAAGKARAGAGADQRRDRRLPLRSAMARKPIHPGEHLGEELKELGISAAELARRLDVPTNRITSILNGQRAVTGDTALRLAHFFGTSAEFWLNLQNLYELRVAEARSGSAIKKLPRLKLEEARA
jgi:addiction module HigA family antidote